jgi:hypothetical protein
MLSSLVVYIQQSKKEKSQHCFSGTKFPLLKITLFSSGL